jgi:hypothetical protein
MRTAFIYGLIGAAVVGALQFLAMTSSLEGTSGGMLYYSPMICYFAFIYFAIKRTKMEQPDQHLPFKTGMKAGGITALIICLVWGAVFFVGLTHTDVVGFVHYKMDHGQQNEIPQYLAAFSSRQNMFDMAKFWSMPNFLLGFLVIILANVLLARKKKSTAQ